MPDKKIKLIFLGDIIGKIGRKAVKQYLPKLIKKYKPNLIVANAENIAHGIGFTQKTLDEVKETGVDIFTSGNHAWKKAGSDDILDKKNSEIIRPNNYKQKSGSGIKKLEVAENKIIMVNLLGEVFMNEEVKSPFKNLKAIINKYGKKNIIIVDFHAEATSEKAAMANYFDGQISAVLGTHTHVPTCDHRILDQGTGFVTDVGMIGYYDSIIGSDKQSIFNLFLNSGKTNKKHDLPEAGPCQFNAIYLEIDPETKRTEIIKRIDKIIKVK